MSDLGQCPTCRCRNPLDLRYAVAARCMNPWHEPGLDAALLRQFSKGPTRPMSDDLDALRQRIVRGTTHSQAGHLAFRQGVDAALAALERDSMHDDTGYCHRDEPFTHATDHPVYRITPDLCAAHADKEATNDD